MFEAETIFVKDNFEKQMAEDFEYLSEKYGEKEVKNLYAKIKKAGKNAEYKYVIVFAENNKLTAKFKSE